ncbi:hypothetical protein Bbelb_023070 [Branchiostoma belcheri]|nr:hypothetical protein Bbelb_023070 [Branchiostoma belcheri]
MSNLHQHFHELGYELDVRHCTKQKVRGHDPGDPSCTGHELDVRHCTKQKVRGHDPGDPSCTGRKHFPSLDFPFIFKQNKITEDAWDLKWGRREDITLTSVQTRGGHIEDVYYSDLCDLTGSVWDVSGQGARPLPSEETDDTAGGRQQSS